MEIFNQLWDGADEKTRNELFTKGRMSTKPKHHAVDMEKLLTPQRTSTCSLFAIKVIEAMKTDGKITAKFLDTGSHGAVVVDNYALIDSSAAEVIKLWEKKGSFIKWSSDTIGDGEGPKGTLWHRASRTGEGFGWFESEIIEEVCNCFHCMAIMFSY